MNSMLILQVEMAVDDLISVAVDRPGGVTPETMVSAVDELRRHYSGLMYRAVLSSTKISLNVIKQRACTKVCLPMLKREKKIRWLKLHWKNSRGHQNYCLHMDLSSI